MRSPAPAGGGTFGRSTWNRSRISARRRAVERASGLGQLDQHAARGGWMQERDVLAFGAKAWCLVDETDARGAAAFERSHEIVDDKAHVMYPGPAFGDEFAYR